MYVNRDKSKKFAEQATATVCLRVLGLSDDRISNHVSELPSDLSPGQQGLADKEPVRTTESTTQQLELVEDTQMNQYNDLSRIATA